MDDCRRLWATAAHISASRVALIQPLNKSQYANPPVYACVLCVVCVLRVVCVVLIIAIGWRNTVTQVPLNIPNLRNRQIWLTRDRRSTSPQGQRSRPAVSAVAWARRSSGGNRHSTMIMAHTALRLPVVGSVIIPSRPKSASAHLTGPACPPSAPWSCWGRRQFRCNTKTTQRLVRQGASPGRQQLVDAGHLQPVFGNPLVDLVGPRLQLVLAGSLHLPWPRQGQSQASRLNSAPRWEPARPWAMPSAFAANRYRRTVLRDRPVPAAICRRPAPACQRRIISCIFHPENLPVSHRCTSNTKCGNDRRYGFQSGSITL